MQLFSWSYRSFVLIMQSHQPLVSEFVSVNCWLYKLDYDKFTIISRFNNCTSEMII